jgi:hypothetical protein
MTPRLVVRGARGVKAVSVRAPTSQVDSAEFSPPPIARLVVSVSSQHVGGHVVISLGGREKGQDGQHAAPRFSSPPACNDSRELTGLEGTMKTHSNNRVSQPPPILVPPSENTAGLVLSLQRTLHQPLLVEPRRSGRAPSSFALQVDTVLVKQLPPLLVKVGPIVSPVKVGCEAKVGDGDVAARICETRDQSKASRLKRSGMRTEKEVVGLDVAVDGSENAVSLADGEDHLGDVEASHFLGEGVAVDEEGE